MNAKGNLTTEFLLAFLFLFQLVKSNDVNGMSIFLNHCSTIYFHSTGVVKLSLSCKLDIKFAIYGLSLPDSV